ncbi:MAG: PorT family protein [Bacteroidales bacterium]|nr:PorT family protein [Bacteroidales bacterium]
MKKIILISIIISTTPIFAQSEFSIGGGAGSSALKFDNSQDALGNNFGLGYTYRFNDKFGVRSGLEAAHYNAVTNRNYTETYALDNVWYSTPAGYNFLYTVAAKNINEKNTATYLQIPLMLQYRHDSTQRSGLYGAGGVKFGIPISGKYSSTIRELTTSGYNEYTRQHHCNNPEEYFSTFTNLSNNHALDFKFGMFFSAEIGTMRQVSKTLKLYIGMYVDHAINNLSNIKTSKTHLIEYNGCNEPVLNSAISRSSKVGATAIGFSVRVGFGN